MRPRKRERKENEITCQNAQRPALKQVSEGKTLGLNVENMEGWGKVC